MEGVDEGLEPPIVGDEICVDENLGELEDAGDAESEMGEGRSVSAADPPVRGINLSDRRETRFDNNFSMLDALGL